MAIKELQLQLDAALTIIAAQEAQLAAYEIVFVNSINSLQLGGRAVRKRREGVKSAKDSLKELGIDLTKKRRCRS